MRVHFLGRRSNHFTTLSTPNESGEYLISFFTLFTFTSYYLNIGDNVHLKCKGVNYDSLENAITLDFCLYDGRCVIKPKEIFVRAILAPNLNFFTTFRSETLVLMSVSWIGVI